METWGSRAMKVRIGNGVSSLTLVGYVDEEEPESPNLLGEGREISHPRPIGLRGMRKCCDTIPVWPWLKVKECEGTHVDGTKRNATGAETEK
ncbi:hypothetical protein H2204_010063 [Knufia peltigerae]|uniref:Uncharacterized protein n=1 Tax=Knufia peltigerae TaxID=1002370 RepID=A0AA38XX22_9EURO|nr:hypothetical protein H2204_010063 [Knufia peltigerae]